MRSHARASTSAPSRAARARRPTASAFVTRTTVSRPRALPSDDVDVADENAPSALDFNAVAREHAMSHGNAPMSARLAKREFGLGDSGTDVALTQRLLGLDFSHGVCDADTSRAIQGFQRSRGLQPSGFFGASSRAQVAKEEEAWRARGGAELLQAYAREARAKDETTRARAGVDWQSRSRAPVWSARAVQGAVWVAAAGVVVGASLAVAKKIKTQTDATRMEEPPLARTPTLKRVRESARALGARTARSLDAVRVSGVARLAAFATLASRARRVVADRVSRLRPPASPSTDAAGDDQSSAITEGHFDASGRWWESPLPRPPAAAEPAVEPAASSPVDAATQKSRRAEQMRERWVNIRRQKVDVGDGIDERRAIKRVSEFLGDDDKHV